jgi:DNA replication protein DnaC
MKHIGEVLGNISIPISTRTGNTSNAAETVKCPICKDAGYLRVDVPIGHPNFGRLFKCECKLQEEAARHRDDLQRISNLHAFADKTFKDFDPEVDGVSEAYRIAYRYALNPDGWLFLHGNCGCGKTHLAAAIANHMISDRGMIVSFNVVPDLLDHLRATFDPGAGVAYDDRFNAVRNAPLLILDDLGTENTTPWAREKLYQIFNHRYNEQLPTVITSNQDFKRIEERVLSRLSDTRLTTYVHIDAEDYRRRFVRDNRHFRR